MDIVVFLLKFSVYKILRLQKIQELKNLGMRSLVLCPKLHVPFFLFLSREEVIQIQKLERAVLG